MDESKDSKLPLPLIPPRIAALFESEEWRDFVRRADEWVSSEKYPKIILSIKKNSHMPKTVFCTHKERESG